MSEGNGKANDQAVASTAIRCVVADDHPAILDAVTRFLEGERGFELVGRAGDGETALHLIGETRPDIALLDIRMPGIGGIDIAAKLAASSSPTAVVLYTAYPERALLLAALDAGVRGFILKEAPLDELLRALRIVFGGGSYIDAALAGVLAGPAAGERMLTLTKRERDVLRLLAEGMRDEQAGRTLSISPLTVRTHVQHAMAKLKCDTRTQAVAVALRESLID
jgi:two-component system response regulator DesR